MDGGFFIRRMLAFVISLILAYIPSAYSFFISGGTSGNFIHMLLSSGLVIFSLIAVLALCFFDMLEVIKQLNITLASAAFVFWFVTIILGIGAYIYSSENSQNGNIIFINVSSIIVTAVEYILFNVLIAQKKEGIRRQTEQSMKKLLQDWHIPENNIAEALELLKIPQ